MKLTHFILLILLLSSCSKSDLQYQTSFYYWRTVFKLNDTEKHVIAANKVERLYVRYFDVDITENGDPFPVAKISFADSTTCKIIPVVFIKNQVMLNEKLNISQLTSNITSLVMQINEQTNSELHEIQIDCDWSAKSKDRFMAFMKELREKWSGKLSATIRLHQVKYFHQTGIPPVDYGVLMFYNMGKIDELTNNSIYDEAIAKQYTPSISQYPLPLKIALPIFSWGIHTQNNQVMGLWNKKTWNDLNNHANLKNIANNRFQVISSFYEDGRFFQKNDIIVHENVSEENLLNIANNLSILNANFDTEIIFYDLDSINTINYDEDIFKNVSIQF